MEKWIIVYSSNTGNTKAVAETMLTVLSQETPLKKAEDMPAADDYDVVAIGYWVDKGSPDMHTRQFLPTVKNKKVVLFQTLGADPMSEHATTSIANAATLLGEGCRIIGTFSCRGKIDEKLIEMMKRLPAEHPHHPNADSIKRWQEASTHPDEADLEAARTFVKNVLGKLEMWKKHLR